MNEIVFLRPWWLLALPLALLAAVAVWRSTTSGGNWRRICDPHLLPHLLVAPADRITRSLVVLTSVAGVLAVVALAGPSWESSAQPMQRTVYGRIVALDVSSSMNVRDVAPDRMTVAQNKARSILEQGGDVQTGLVVFAGEAFAVTPLTTDYKALLEVLPAFDVSVMPAQGSQIDTALIEARTMLQAAGMSAGEIVVITDGTRGERAMAVASSLSNDGFHVSVLGVGTARGGPIPTTDGSTMRALDGTQVVAKLDLDKLQTLASVGGGKFVQSSADDGDVEELLAASANWQLDAGSERVTRETRLRTDQGALFVLALLPLVAIGFRRGWLLSALPLVFCMTLTLPSPALALDGGEGTLGTCSGENAEETIDRAVILFRRGDYLTAAYFFSCGSDADAHYNRGTSLAHAWRLQPAMTAFTEALARDPEHTDARHNLAVVAGLLQEQRSGSGGDGSSSGVQAGGGASDGSDADNGMSQESTTQADDGRAGDKAEVPLDEASDASVERLGAGAGRRLRHKDGYPTAGELAALHARLDQISDDPATLWRRKLYMRYWRRGSLRAPRVDAW